MSDLQSTLNKINRLQQSEEQLYQALTQDAQNVASGKENTFSNDEIEEMTIQINSLSEARTNLYNLIAKLYDEEVKNTGSLKNSYDDQIKTLELLEKQLSESKKQLSKLKDKKYNQLKMIEINSYYSKEYDAYRHFFKTITLIGLCILATVVLDYFIPSSGFTYYIRMVIFIVGGLIIVRQYVNMQMHSSNNYDEYTWMAAPTTTDELGIATSTEPIIDISGVNVPYLCATDGCCGEGTVWNPDEGCIVDRKI